MRVMMLVKGDIEPGQVPDDDALEVMADYNDELLKADVLVDLNGLHPGAEAVRVKFEKDGTSVEKGPFPNREDLTAGYWILDVKSIDEAIDWAKRAPFAPGVEGGPPAVIEIRQVFGTEEFPESPAVEHVRRIGKELAAKK